MAKTHLQTHPEHQVEKWFMDYRKWLKIRKLNSWKEFGIRTRLVLRFGIDLES